MCQPDDDFLDYYPCPECDGQGWICECCDDICAARGECMHGDGDVTCPLCLGDGEIYDPVGT